MIVQMCRSYVRARHIQKIANLGMDPPFVQDEDIADLTAALSLISRLRSEKDEYRCAPRHHQFVREI